MNQTTLLQEIRDRVPGLSDPDVGGLLPGAAALAAGLLTRSLIEAAWRRFTHDEPPRNPAGRETGWGEAVAWTVAVGVAVGTARLLARRGAVAARDALSG